MTRIFKSITTALLALLATGSAFAQSETADSLLASQLRSEGIAFSHNNSVTLLMNGQEKFDDLFRAIDQARSTIHMEYFNFRNDSINRELIKHLAPKAKEGVKIRLVFDGFGNTSNNSPMRKRDLKYIRSLGIEIHEFNPVRFPWIDDVFNRDHRKIVVIDGRIAYTGGMNIADYYIKGTEKVGSWHDMHCRITGQEVNTLQRIFVKMWEQVTERGLNDSGLYHGGQDVSYFHGLKPDTCRSAGHKMVGIINREPHNGNKIVRRFYLDAINDAKDSIKIINPYFTLSHNLKKALKNAVKRGVDVQILLSVKSDIPLTPDCGFYNAHKLMKHGCKVWMYKPGFHHTKIIMVDGRICTVGSANLNARSLRWDREENAVILDKCTTKQLDNLFESQKKDSFYLTEETWNQWRSGWDKFKGWFGHLLAPFL